jgi:uncharacterized protein YcbK (DUF882 family)
MSVSRRLLLRSGAALAGLSLTGLSQPLFADESAPRRIAFTNLHTGEHLDTEYFRHGETHSIDPKLMDYLVDVAAKLGAKAAFSVISGYRSPETNEKLHEKSSGVAQHSLHMQGRAIDVRIAGVDCATLAASALELKRGGVGYYRASNFVHLDTGAFRTWRG